MSTGLFGPCVVVRQPLLHSFVQAVSTLRRVALGNLRRPTLRGTYRIALYPGGKFLSDTQQALSATDATITVQSS